MSKKSSTATATPQPKGELIPFNDEYTQALTLHQRIMANGQLASTAFIEMCKDLKEMRDKALYTALGFDTFDAYAEAEVGIKSRQAYNYIRVYEQLKPDLLAAGYGIKKLELLTAIPAMERDAFVEENDIEGMTVQELKDRIRELNGANEQLTIQLEEHAKEVEALDEAGVADQWTDRQRETEEALAAAEAARDEARLEREAAEAARDEAVAQLAELQASPTAEAVDIERIKTDLINEMSDQLKADALAEALAEAEKEQKKAIKAAADAARQKAEAETAKQVNKAKEEARKAALEEAEKQKAEELARMESEKKAAAERAAELEKQLGLVSSTETTAFAIHYEQFAAAFDKMLEQVAQLREKEMTEQADKLTAALCQSLEKLAGVLKESRK